MSSEQGQPSVNFRRAMRAESRLPLGHWPRGLRRRRRERQAHAQRTRLVRAFAPLEGIVEAQRMAPPLLRRQLRACVAMPALVGVEYQGCGRGRHGGGAPWPRPRARPRARPRPGSKYVNPDAASGGLSRQVLETGVLYEPRAITKLARRDRWARSARELSDVEAAVEEANRATKRRCAAAHPFPSPSSCLDSLQAHTLFRNFCLSTCSCVSP
jgi:hypothetical protein